MRPETDEPSVERFARVTPPVGHEARVRARSGPAADTRTVAAATPHGLAWRWVLPVTASVLVVVGAVWQSNRASRHVQLAPPAASDEWNGKGVDVPVLPPRAYWEMSAVDEFERLRETAPPARVDLATRGERRPAAVRDVLARNWAPHPSSLPPIVIEDISPESIEIPAIAAPEPIMLAPIDITPIDLGSWDQEER